MGSFDTRNTWRARLSGAAGARTKWVTVAVTIALSAAALLLVGDPLKATGPTAGLPDDADSTAVVALQQQLPSSETEPLVVVVTGPQAFTATDRTDVAQLAEQLRRFAVDSRVPPPQISAGGDTALLLVPIPSDQSDEDSRSQVEEVRAAVQDGLPDGLTAEVTGGPAFRVDIVAAFDGANVTLLVTTAAVVALLLLITYRSPWLWLVPLAVIGLADQVAARAVALATRLTSLRVDDSTIGIVSVLVFGAGTNYALLLIARYREELRRHDDRHAAMTSAVRQAAPAILASSGTVVLALLTLGLAQTPGNRSLGYAGAIGITTAVAYALLLLPACLVLFGRRLFWPFVPRLGQADPARSGVWARAGRAVIRRPVLVAAGAGAALALMASGALGLSVGLTQTEQFTAKPESVVGQEKLARAFPVGATDPAAIVAPPGDLARVKAAAETVVGISRVTAGDAAEQVAQLNAVVDAPPGTAASFDTIRSLRQSVAAASQGRALVGGTEARDLDARAAASADQRLIVPLILAVVGVILLVVLRSLVAAALLIATVVLSFGASLGLSWVVFDRFTDFSALDLSVPLLSFLFLVALGVDYNIFLTTRAREEARTLPTSEAMVNALSVTGGVITSAGILLAAVFAVLGVLPVIALTQLGVIVGIGVLLDTLLVRTLLVPALATWAGTRFWWPGDPQRQPAAPAQPRRALLPHPSADLVAPVPAGQHP